MSKRAHAVRAALCSVLLMVSLVLAGCLKPNGNGAINGPFMLDLLPDRSEISWEYGDSNVIAPTNLHTINAILSNAIKTSMPLQVRYDGRYHMDVPAVHTTASNSGERFSESMEIDIGSMSFSAEPFEETEHSIFSYRRCETFFKLENPVVITETVTHDSGNSTTYTCTVQTLELNWYYELEDNGALLVDENGNSSMDAFTTTSLCEADVVISPSNGESYEEHYGFTPTIGFFKLIGLGKDINVFTNASELIGDAAVVIVPAAIVVGAGVAGVRIAKNRKSKNQRQDETEQKEEKKPKSSYLMILNKDFGNELRAGGKAKEVSARIEERIPTQVGANAYGYSLKRRDDLTQNIRVKGVENIVVDSVRFLPPHMTASIRVPEEAAKLKGAKRRAVVSFTYAGETSNFVNNVVFNLAPEPKLLFVKEPDGVTYWFNTSRVNALIGDAKEGTTFYFAVENFTEQPDDPEIVPTDANISVECEPFEDKRLPKLYIYKVKVTNAIPFDSPYGEWPLEHKLHITVKNDFGERAEDNLKLNLWPEGISFDVRQIKHERRRKDSVVVDTSDILMSSGPMQNIEGAVMEVAVAYKDDEGNVVVARPTEPRDGSYLRLEGEDENSNEVLNPNGYDVGIPRIWYTLSYLKKSTYSQNGRLGTLTLTPLMPAVSSNPDEEYLGSVDLTYDKGAYHFDAKARFAVRGLSSFMVDADAQTERARIRKILNAYRLENWEHVAAVLQKHGPAAERELQHLGEGEDRQATGKTVEELMELVNEVQSVQRLRAIRKMVYEACELTATHDAIKAQSTAELYGFLYNTAITVRWANDIAFTCWCYAFMGPNAAYVVPFIAPLRTWLEDFLAILVSCVWDGEMEGELKKLFSEKRLLEIINKSFEDELLAIIAGALGSGGTSLLKDPNTYKAIGGAYCFFFLKHLGKNIYKSSQKGKVEYDIWGALKDATADMTLFSIKALVAIFVARKFSQFKPKKEELFKPSEDVFSYDGMNPIERVIAKSFSWMVRTMEKTFNIVGNTLVKVGEGADDIVDHIVTRGDVAMTFTQVLTNQPALGTDAQREVWGAFYDVITQQEVEGVASEGFTAWVQRFGTVPFHLRDELGELKRLDVPLISFVAMWIDWVFEYLGIGGDLNIVKLTDSPEYYEHDDLFALIGKIEGAGGEVDFLLNPRGTDTSYSTSTTTGTWHTYDDSASGSSGTGIDTSTDTSTGW